MMYEIVTESGDSHETRHLLRCMKILQQIGEQGERARAWEYENDGTLIAVIERRPVAPLFEGVGDE